jgi:hypothetical protein
MNQPGCRALLISFILFSKSVESGADGKPQACWLPEVRLSNGSGKLIMETIVETQASSIVQFIAVYEANCMFATCLVALPQDAPNQAPRKTQAAAGAGLTNIMGAVQENGDKLRFVTDQRAWNVNNPKTIKGHEGR